MLEHPAEPDNEEERWLPSILEALCTSGAGKTSNVSDGDGAATLSGYNI